MTDAERSTPRPNGGRFDAPPILDCGGTLRLDRAGQLVVDQEPRPTAAPLDHAPGPRIRASVPVVTTTSASRQRQKARSPRRRLGGVYGPARRFTRAPPVRVG